jgi:hypothetical protein
MLGPVKLWSMQMEALFCWQQCRMHSMSTIDHNWAHWANFHSPQAGPAPEKPKALFGSWGSNPWREPTPAGMGWSPLLHPIPLWDWTPIISSLNLCSVNPVNFPSHSSPVLLPCAPELHGDLLPSLHRRHHRAPRRPVAVPPLPPPWRSTTTRRCPSTVAAEVHHDLSPFPPPPPLPWWTPTRRRPSTGAAAEVHGDSSRSSTAAAKPPQTSQERRSKTFSFYELYRFGISSTG